MDNGSETQFTKCFIVNYEFYCVTPSNEKFYGKTFFDPESFHFTEWVSILHCHDPNSLVRTVTSVYLRYEN